jgi:anti-sigma factor RsiW
MDECIRIVPMIGAREGELSDAEARALEAHLAGCAACRAVAADTESTDGLVSEALMARANARDFAPFVDEVMARVARRERRGVRAWLSLHRRAAAAALAPVLAALAVIVYVRVDGGREPMAFLELSSEGEVTTVLQTVDGPVVLLIEDAGS